MAATENLAQYVKDKAINLSAMSRATGVPYACLYASLGEGGRKRPLSVDEAILVCKFLEVDPRDFASNDGAQGSEAEERHINNKKATSLSSGLMY